LIRILTVLLLGLLFEPLGLAPAAAQGRAAAPVDLPRPRFDKTLAAAGTVRLPWSAPGFRFQPSVEAGANPVDGSDRWRLPPAASPDWPGIGRDTAYFLGYQFVAVGILFVAPESISGWSEEDKDNYDIDKWKANVRDPIWDKDAWWINYITHPYWGAAYYIRARERGFEPMPAFWYSALLSTLFEFGAEALFERPSYQDLVVTPVAGALIGEYLFSPLRERIRAKPGQLVWSDKALLFATDPLGVLNAEVDRLFGLNLNWRFGPVSMAEMSPVSSLPDAAATTLSPTFQTGVKPVWSLQLQITW
jgi:hypothetical protein